MRSEYLKCLISFIVVPIEVLFIAPPLALDKHHDDIIFLYDTCTYIKETETAK